MPKLLRKSIWKSMVELSLLCLLFYAVMAFVGTLVGGYHQVGFFLDLIIVIVMYSFSESGSALPDYIFIAPFSFEDRKNLMRKFFIANMLMKFLCLSTLSFVSSFIEVVRFHNLQILASSFLQIIILSGIVYVLSYVKYFRECSVVGQIGVIVVSTLWEGVFAGFLDAKDGFALSEKMFLVFVVIAVILTAFLIGYYHVRHFEAMVNYYADYKENRCQQ